jgi:hypothetical protein
LIVGDGQPGKEQHSRTLALRAKASATTIGMVFRQEVLAGTEIRRSYRRSNTCR